MSIRKTITITFLILVCLVSFSCTRNQRKNAAKAAALEYAQELFPNKEVNATCSTDDSDGDGYISCDVVVGDNIYPIECTYSYIGRTTGCKKRVLLDTKK